MMRPAGRWRCTSIVDVAEGQLLDVVGGATPTVPPGGCWSNPGRGARASPGVRWGSRGRIRRAFDVALPHIGGVADPFHVIRLANSSIDEVRRRVPNDTLGHRGRKDDPLWRVRRLLIPAHERLSERGDAKLRGLLASGDAH